MYELAIKHDKDMEEIQQKFNEQTAFICSICFAEMDCKNEIATLPCLHVLLFASDLLGASPPDICITSGIS